MRKIIIIAIVLFANTNIKAQDQIKGKVVEQLENGSETPIPGANVYWEGTTIGVATNENGNYSIENIPPGKYEVIFWQERLSNVDEKKYVLQNSSLEINITDNQNTTQNFTFTKPQKIEQ